MNADFENVIPGKDSVIKTTICFRCPACGAIFTMTFAHIKYELSYAIKGACPACGYKKDDWNFSSYMISSFHYKWLRFFRSLKKQVKENDGS